MSVEAISWALNLAPVPADRGGQPSSACKFVLVGLANHAGPDGTGAFPSVATLVRYTGLSERTVRTCLDRLAVAGIIECGDGWAGFRSPSSVGFEGTTPRWGHGQRRPATHRRTGLCAPARGHFGKGA